MLRQLGTWPSLTILPSHLNCINFTHVPTSFTRNNLLKVKLEGVLVTRCRARRRVRYGVEEEDDDDDGYNEDVAMLEMYTQMVKDEVLLVTALVDEEIVELLIFKGFSSCLSYETSSDPSKSVVPAKSVIKSIDRVRGPFDPSNIQYIEKGLTFQEFKNRIK